MSPRRTAWPRSPAHTATCRGRAPPPRSRLRARPSPTAAAPALRDRRRPSRRVKKSCGLQARTAQTIPIVVPPVVVPEVQAATVLARGCRTYSALWTACGSRTPARVQSKSPPTVVQSSMYVPTLSLRHVLTALPAASPRLSTELARRVGSPVCVHSALDSSCVAVQPIILSTANLDRTRAVCGVRVCAVHGLGTQVNPASRIDNFRETVPNMVRVHAKSSLRTPHCSRLATPFCAPSSRSLSAVQKYPRPRHTHARARTHTHT